MTRQTANVTPRLAGLVLGLLVVGCGSGGGREGGTVPGPTPEGITTYLPEASSPGFNLVLQDRRVPTIRDMNGHVVHSWPDVRATDRVRLGRDCNLTVIGTDDRVKQLDWDGNLLRTYSLLDEADFPHHDLIQLENGNFLLLARSETTKEEYLLEVDSNDRKVWEWRAKDHAGVFASWDLDAKHLPHINSIREIPQNRWFREGDARFRPGNILVSGRNLNTIFVIDKSDGSVVWQYSTGLDHPHEAVMLADGAEHEGMILLFNNGLENLYDYRRTRVQIIDPQQEVPVWEYRSEFFFSSAAGVAQQLAGGNILITSSRGGRIFEITPRGRTVWEWIPSYRPMRPERLAYDHCQRLAAIEPSSPVRVDPNHDQPYIDRDLYKFAVDLKTRKRQLFGEMRTLLRTPNVCRELLIPADAVMSIEFGLDRERLRKASGPLTARFRITAAPLDQNGDAGIPETLLDEVLVSDHDEHWHRQRVELPGLDYQRVELCLSIDVSGAEESVRLVAVWGVPGIRSRSAPESESDEESELSQEEQELRRKRLEAFGYVN